MIGVVSVTALIGIYYGVSTSGLPLAVAETQLNIELDQFQKRLTYLEFMEFNEHDKKDLVKKMSYTTINLLLNAEAKINTVTNEELSEIRNKLDYSEKLYFKQSAVLQGIKGNDAKGIAMIIDAADKSFLRFEDFSVINGPDLYVYLTTDGDINNRIEIGKLKANNGQQNYEITGIDTKTYNVVVIYSKTFEIYFALAKFSSM